MDAIIKDNKAYCPFCESNSYRVGQPKQLEEGTQITAICNNCDREFEYYLKCTIENNVRWI